MDRTAKIAAIFQALGEKQYPFALAEVLSVEGVSCTVKLVDGVEDLVLDEVLLKSILDGKEDGFYLIPAVGSLVWLAVLDEENKAFVAQTDVVENLLYKNGALSLIVDANKMDLMTENMQLQATDALIKLKVQESTMEVLDSAINLVSGGKFDFSNAQTSLKSILNAIVTMVKQLTVATAVGPSGPPLPPTLAEATLVETDVTNLFS